MKKYSYIFLFILIQISGFAEIIPSARIQNERQYADRIAIQKEAQKQLAQNTGASRLYYLRSLKFRKEFDEVISQQEYCSTEISLPELLSGKRKELPKDAEKQLKKDANTLNSQILENEKLVREGHVDQTSYIVDLRKANNQPSFIKATKLAEVNAKLQQINQNVQTVTGTTGVAFYVLLNMYFPDTGLTLNGLTREEYLKKYMTELYNRSRLTSNGILLNVESFLRAAPGNATSETTAAPSKYLLSYQPFVALGKNLTEQSIDELIATNITVLGGKPGFEFGVTGASPYENNDYRGTVLDNYVTAIDDVIKGKVTENQNFLQTETNAEFFAELKLKTEDKDKLLEILKKVNTEPTLTDQLRDYAGVEPFLEKLFGDYYSNQTSSDLKLLTIRVVATSDLNTNQGLSAIQMAKEMPPDPNGLTLGLHFLEPASSDQNIRIRYTAIYGSEYEVLVKAELNHVFEDMRLLDYADLTQKVSGQIFDTFLDVFGAINSVLKKIRIPERWWNTDSILSLDPFLCGVVNAILDDLVGIVQLVGAVIEVGVGVQYYLLQLVLYMHELSRNPEKRNEILAEIDAIIENWFPILRDGLVNSVTFFMTLEGAYKDEFFKSIPKNKQLEFLEGMRNATSIKDLALNFVPFLAVLQLDIQRLTLKAIGKLAARGWEELKKTNLREIEYYSGYTAVQIVGCFVGVTEAVALLKGGTAAVKVVNEVSSALKTLKVSLKSGDDFVLFLKNIFSTITKGVDGDAYRKALKKLGKKVEKSKLLAKLDNLNLPHTKKWINRLDETADADLLTKVDDIVDHDPDKLVELEKLYENMAAPAQKKGMGDFTIKVDGKDVYYDKNGFPDFAPHSPGKNYAVESEGLVGRNPNPGPQNLHPDFDIANKELIKRYGEGNIDIRHATGSPVLIKIDGKWEGPFTWHHHQDGKTLMPVLQSIHKGSSHSGGTDIIIKGLQGLFNSPF